MSVAMEVFNEIQDLFLLLNSSFVFPGGAMSQVSVLRGTKASVVAWIASVVVVSRLSSALQF